MIFLRDKQASAHAAVLLTPLLRAPRLRRHTILLHAEQCMPARGSQRAARLLPSQFGVRARDRTRTKNFVEAHPIRMLMGKV